MVVGYQQPAPLRLPSRSQEDAEDGDFEFGWHPAFILQTCDECSPTELRVSFHQKDVQQRSTYSSRWSLKQKGRKLLATSLLDSALLTCPRKSKGMALLKDALPHGQVSSWTATLPRDVDKAFIGLVAGKDLSQGYLNTSGVGTRKGSRQFGVDSDNGFYVGQDDPAHFPRWSHWDSARGNEVRFECDLRKDIYTLTLWANGVKLGTKGRPYTMKLPKDQSIRWFPSVGLSSGASQKSVEVSFGDQSFRDRCL